jgi:hypothetical protein
MSCRVADSENSTTGIYFIMLGLEADGRHDLALDML